MPYETGQHNSRGIADLAPGSIPRYRVIHRLRYDAKIHTPQSDENKTEYYWWHDVIISYKKEIVMGSSLEFQY